MTFLASPSTSLSAGDDSWQQLVTVRVGNIDAIDADDGNLAAFLRSIRNDGRFVPPVRTLVGPRLCNNTFFGLKYEAWLECLVLVHSRPGPTELVWVFPVDNRDEYLEHFANQGLAEYEGMDGVTVIRQMEQDGSIRNWHMEWLPGGIAVFGANRGAVVSTRQLYAENRAAKGLLAGAGGDYLEPDIMVRLHPAQLLTWRDNSPALYWWREKITLLTRDLLRYWNPNTARTRLIYAFSDAFAAWPRQLRRLDASVWFEREGVELRLDVEGDFQAVGKSELAALRRMPERAAMAYAVPVSESSFGRYGEAVGDLFLAAAGGVVTKEAKADAQAVFATLRQAGIRQIALAWVAPPSDAPELGAARLLVLECDKPEAIMAAWNKLQALKTPESAIAHALAQIGWSVAISPIDSGTHSTELAITSSSGDTYYNATLSFGLRDNWFSLVTGENRIDSAEKERVVKYRESLATQALEGDPSGIPAVRAAFTRVGMAGVSFVGFFDPVRFFQLALIDSADWRPRSPDQAEPLSVQMAREMMEYGSAAAWTAAGGIDGDIWKISGGMSWSGLVRLSAALGITESVGTEQ